MVRPIEFLDNAMEPIRLRGARKGGGCERVSWDQLDAYGVLGLTWTAGRLHPEGLAELRFLRCDECEFFRLHRETIPTAAARRLRRVVDDGRGVSIAQRADGAAGHPGIEPRPGGKARDNTPSFRRWLG